MEKNDDEKTSQTLNNRLQTRDFYIYIRDALKRIRYAQLNHDILLRN